MGLPAEQPDERRAENERHVDRRLGLLNPLALCVFVSGKAARDTQIPDGQSKIEALSLDAEKVGYFLGGEGPAMKVEAVETQVVAGADEVLDADPDALVAEVVAADLYHCSLKREMVYNGAPRRHD